MVGVLDGETDENETAPPEAAEASTGPVAPWDPLPTEPEEIDYWPLAAASAKAALLALVAKVLSSLLLASYLGITIEIRFFWFVFPYLAFRTSQNTLIDIVTGSAVIMAVVASVAFLIVLFQVRGRARDQRATGWYIGVVVTALTLLLEWIRHLIERPLLHVEIAAQIAAGLLAVSVVYFGFRLVQRKEPVDAQDDRDVDEPESVAAATPVEPAETIGPPLPTRQAASDPAPDESRASDEAPAAPVTNEAESGTDPEPEDRSTADGGPTIEIVQEDSLT